MTIRSVLFDFDGTLVDTAPDLTHAVNHIRHQLQLPELSLEVTRPIAGNGAKALIAAGEDIAEQHDRDDLAKSLFSHYHENIYIDTQFFPGVIEVIKHLDQMNIPWGIVTNRHEFLTFPLIEHLPFPSQPACVVCGDTLSKSKPHPEPILHALQQIQQDAVDCLYIGDHQRDIEAGKAANTQTVAALYGYVEESEQPHQWGSDYIINHPLEILDIIK